MTPENDQVLAALDGEAAAGRPFALATIVTTTGSTYRHAGARLLVKADETSVGNLSGGCLEGEVVEVGARVIASGRAEMVGYDLTADEEAIWGWGLGCNGAIDVLVEPQRSATEAVRLLRAGAASERPHVLATVTRMDDGTVMPASHLLVLEDGTTDGSLDGAVAAAIATAAQRAAADRTSGVERLSVDGRDVEVFLEVVRPPLRLLVCGAGHDAIPLVRAAAQLGWHPIVVDDRSAFVTQDRFPGAAGLVRAEPAKAAEEAGVDDLTYVVVMSHNYLRDQDYLASFLGSGYAYLGMLGPRQRLDRLLAELRGRGIEPHPDELPRIHGPAGLDIGADGPDEIAWAICAEILAVSRGRSAGFLRDREAPIHARAGQAVQSPV